MRVKINKTPEANNGLNITDGSMEMLSPSFGSLNGKSHEKGGVQFEYNGSPAEAYGGESFSIMPNGDMSIFGKQKIKLNGKTTTFNKYAQNLAEEENKANKQIKKADDMLQSVPQTKWGALSTNTAKILAEGAGMKKSLIDAERQTLSALQDTRLSLSANIEVDPKEIPAFKNGGIVRFDPGGRMTLAEKNNNPGNLKDIKGNFIKFNSYEEGMAALQKKLMNASTGKSRVYKQDFTLYDFYNKYAPSSDKNNPKQYAENIAKKLKVDPNTPISQLKDRIPQWAEYTAQQEDVAYSKKRGSFNPTPPDQPLPINPIPVEWPTVAPPSWNMGDPSTVTEKPLGDSSINYNYTSATPIPPDSPTPFVGWGTSSPPQNPQQRKPSLTEQNRFNPLSILPELGGVLSQPDAVPYQQYNPTLFTPYQVSYQDQINNNNATFRQLGQQVDNPAALSILAGQNYAQNNQVMAQQFRANQEINNQVTNQNVQLLNQAELQNLQLQDIQQQRMSQAKSNTRRDRNIAANSIAAKIAQNKQENNTIRLYETMSDYRYDPKIQNYQYYGEGSNFSIPGNGVPSPTTKTVVTDKNGKQTVTEQYSKLDNAQALTQEQMMQMMQVYGKDFRPNSRRR